ncbi:hypothetical protein GTW25_00360 [Aliihoeflea aestuarii]|jgi:hypothetical protein|uniref:hypothetical protein n=1 Tax=Aliihoeflea aestuarii TaxID=453840 RepID=UPI002093F7C5|nr:hypothetical protein [Aliihoeflea aestuarii]MCO6389481.1 hypothetical protein [Aliihoeflea aestuarii]
MSIENTPFLRRVLQADAAMGVAAAVPTIFAAGYLSTLLSLPEGLIFWAGIALLPIAAFLVVMARKPVIPVGWLREIVLINGAWVVASFALLLSRLVEPNLLGTAFIVAQALAVAGFATLQFGALRGGRQIAA